MSDLDSRFTALLCEALHELGSGLVFFLPVSILLFLAVGKQRDRAKAIAEIIVVLGWVGFIAIRAVARNTFQRKK